MDLSAGGLKRGLESGLYSERNQIELGVFSFVKSDIVVEGKGERVQR